MGRRLRTRIKGERAARRNARAMSPSTVATDTPAGRAGGGLSDTLARRASAGLSHFRAGVARVEQHRGAEAEPLLREALRLRPDDPDILNHLGRALWQQGLLEQAEPCFAQANRIKPHDPHIWNNLGRTCWELGREEEAAACYRRALEIEPELFEAILNLGAMLVDLWQLDEAKVWLDRARRARPDSPDVLQNQGLVLERLGQPAAALDLFEQALRLRPHYAELHRNRATVWLNQGDFERGWSEYEWRLKCRRHPGVVVRRPRWTGEVLPQGSIMLHFEAGLGDTLHFIRFARLVKERVGCVLVLCQTSLLKVVAPCAGVDLAFDGTSWQPDFDVHAPLLSLPAILDTTLATLSNRVPYLQTDPLVVERWRAILARAIGVEIDTRSGAAERAGAERPVRPFLIGVAWQGNPLHRWDRWRSFPLAKLAPLAELPGVTLISLQSEDGLDQLRAPGRCFPVVELSSSRQRDFLDTAAIISLLDLVVTPDSAVAHLAGGLGARVWVALTTIPEWRWMAARTDSPWYPTASLFRQKTLGDWDDVFRRMAEALKPELAARGLHSRGCMTWRPED
jgi:Flp pilus assembly protein TadD